MRRSSRHRHPRHITTCSLCDNDGRSSRGHGRSSISDFDSWRWRGMRRGSIERRGLRERYHPPPGPGVGPSHCSTTGLPVWRALQYSRPTQSCQTIYQNLPSTIGPPCGMPPSFGLGSFQVWDRRIFAMFATIAPPSPHNCWHPGHPKV